MARALPGAENAGRQGNERVEGSGSGSAIDDLFLLRPAFLSMGLPREVVARSHERIRREKGLRAKPGFKNRTHHLPALCERSQIK